MFYLLSSFSLLDSSFFLYAQALGVNHFYIYTYIYLYLISGRVLVNVIHEKSEHLPLLSRSHCLALAHWDGPIPIMSRHHKGI